MGAKGPNGKVNIIITVAKRKRVHEVVDIIKGFNPNSFYSIEDVRYAYHEDGHRDSRLKHFLDMMKKGK